MGKATDKTIGLIGLGVMGQGIALNLMRHGYQTFVYDKDQEKTQHLAERAKGGSVYPRSTLQELVESLEKPRKILLLVRAGSDTDTAIEELVPLLESDDMIVDLGNSHYQDTKRREISLGQKKIRFLGTGISGGEKGAQEGPAIMAGGDYSAWQEMEPVLRSIAAPRAEGQSCCGYFGRNGAGHFVKMVHNGIEYGYMELIAEIYLLAKERYGLEPKKAASLFQAFQKDGRVSSYLVGITAKILEKMDEQTGKPLIQLIADGAGNKGTGKWTSEAALELGACVPVLTEALYVRYLSAEPRPKGQSRRQEAKASFKKEDQEELRQALEFGQYLCFENGLKLIAKAAAASGWDMDLKKLLDTWENGCIIRTEFSSMIKGACKDAEKAGTILENAGISAILKQTRSGAKKVLKKALDSNVPMPCLSAALQYETAYGSQQLPTVMIQAQRDFFGAHGYRRIDQGGMFHTDWEA